MAQEQEAGAVEGAIVGRPATSKDPVWQGRIASAEIPPIPSSNHYLSEVGYYEVRNAKNFEDLNLADAAAGFVSFRPITMLMRRWPFRAFMMLAAFVIACIGLMYWPSEAREVDIDSPITTQITAAAGRFLVAATLLVAVCVAWQGAPRMGTFLLGIAALVSAAALISLWLIWAAVEGDVPAIVHRCVQVLIRLAAAYLCFFREDRWWPVALGTSSAGLLTSVVLFITSRYRDGLVEGGIAAVFLICTSIFMLWRAITLRKAYLATKPDQLLYDEIWQPVRAQKYEELKKLAAVVDSRQHRRVMQRILSLEEIFQHGYSLNAWYQEIVASWAAACGVRYQNAKVKSFNRTLEKVQRSYKGRIPPVIDIVRSTIIVDQIEHAQQVLEYVLERAIVHQVKNRFDVNYNAEQTAGYRDLNLHLSFRELVGTTFEGFVFELQIHYAPILAVKSEDGHKRYITLRNLRGE